MKIRGIDVSKHQGAVDWSKVKKSGYYQFAMLRMGYGGDKKTQDDPTFETNVKRCEKHGIDWGAYLYSYALNTKDAASEAQHAIRLLENYRPTYPIVFDMEDADGYKARHGMPSNDMLVNICETFLKTLEREGYYVSLYASTSWLQNQLRSPKLDAYDKWVAQWGDKCTYSGEFGMWQYTDRAVVDGVAGNVDANIAYLDYPQIIKSAGLNGWPKKSQGAQTAKTDSNYYVVQPGDTLSGIAIKFNKNFWHLAKINRISNPDLIYPGQKLKINE